MEKEKENKIAEEFEDLRTPQEILREKFAEIFPGLEESKLDSGMDELMQNHPEADLADLSCDGLFAVFAKGRGDDMTGIYEDYTEYSRMAEEKASENVRRRTDRSTFCGSARNTASRAGLSDTQYALLREWNSEHPEYAMTAKEYMASLKNN